MSDSYANMLSQYDLSCNSLFGLIAETRNQNNMLLMKGLDFERCLVDVIAEVLEKRGFKHKPLAEKAWKGKKDPGTKWRKIRNGTYPRGLKVEDAYSLVAAMGMSFVELCGMAQGRMLENMPPSTDSIPEKNAEQKPRPPTTHQTNTPPTAGNGK